jgi:hypothetical protein
MFALFLAMKWNYYFSQETPFDDGKTNTVRRQIALYPMFFRIASAIRTNSLAERPPAWQRSRIN